MTSAHEGKISSPAITLQLKQFFTVRKISVFPSVGSWIALMFLIAFSAITIALSSDLSFEMSFVYGMLPSLLIVPLLTWTTSMDLISNNQIAKRFMECLLLIMFYVPMFVSLLVFGAVTMWLTAKVPLGDNLLDSWDKAMGLDWNVYAEWFRKYPLLMSLSANCYTMLCPALLVVGLEAVIVGQPERCKSLIFLTLSTCIFSISFGAFFPSYGPVFRLGSAELHAVLPANYGADHLMLLDLLRSGLPAHIDPKFLAGLVSFPSFHTISCIILVYASRGNMLRLMAVSVFSFLMLVAIPVYGEHYFVDILFGLGVAFIAIWAERRFLNTRAKHQLS